MFKYFLGFFVFFFQPVMEPAFAQSGGDSVETAGISSDSLSMQVSDNGYLSSVSIREVPKKQVDSYLKNPDYAYANDPEYWKKQTPQEPGTFLRFLFSAPVRWIFFFGMIGIILFGIYQLARENNFRWLTREGKKNNFATDEQLSDEKMDYDQAIHRYQAEGNYRMAVRYMYLRLIRTAREKSGISFRDSSTNAEITRAFGNHPQAGEFRFLATAYEYIFYGGFLPEPELFNLLKNKFEVFQQTLTV